MELRVRHEVQLLDVPPEPLLVRQWPGLRRAPLHPHQVRDELYVDAQARHEGSSEPHDPVLPLHQQPHREVEE